MREGAFTASAERPESGAPEVRSFESSPELKQQTAKLREQARERARGKVADRFQRFLKRHQGKLFTAVWLGGGAAYARDGFDAMRSELFNAGSEIALERQPRVDPSPEERLPSVQDMKEELEQMFGEEKFRQMVPLEAKDLVPTGRGEAAKQEVSVGKAKTVEVHGDRTQAEGVRAMAHAILPGPWTTAESVDRVRISKDPIPMAHHDGVQGYAAGLCKRGTGDAPSVIEFAPDNEIGTIEFQRTLAHQYAHGNDWQSSADLSYPERVTLLYRVQKRVDASDHIPFPDVEAVGQAKKEDDHRATEYWAKLMESALVNHAPTQQEWERAFLSTHGIQGVDAKPDLALVKWYLKTVDPDFKPWKTAERRKAVERERWEALLHREIERFPAGALKMHLVHGSAAGEAPHGATHEQQSLWAHYQQLSELSRDIRQAALQDGSSKAFEQIQTFSKEAVSFLELWKHLPAHERQAFEQLVERS